MSKENEMKEQVKKNNKGFSLVELIVVIAIMAILIGVVGMQVLPYMEKARRARDEQMVSAVCTAAATTFAEHADELGTAATYTYVYGTTDQGEVTGNANTAINASLRELLGINDAAVALFPGYFSNAATDTTATRLESRIGKTATNVTITYTVATGEVSVQLRNSTAIPATPATLVLHAATAR